VKLRIKVEDSSYDVQVDVLPEGTASAPDPDQDLPVYHLPPYPTDTIPDDIICRSPIAGSVVSVAVASGRRVHQGDTIATIEAMKMQTAIGAPVAGIVEEIKVKPGDAVKPGQVLCTLV
jgi:biotin carboxyl carrier protein